MLFFGCATTQQIKIVVQGHQFKTGKTMDSIVGAIVATLQEENISITTINEKFGIINTGIQNVPGSAVVKWRGDPDLGLGTAIWTVEITFNVTKTGDVTMKYCQHIKDPWSGVDSCNPNKADVVTNYFERKIKSKL